MTTCYWSTFLVGHEAHELSSCVQAEFLHGVGAVRFDRAQCDTQRSGDLGVGVPEGKQLEDLLFPPGEREQGAPVLAARDLVPFRQCSTQGRLDVFLTSRHPTDRIEQLLGSDRLEDIPVVPGREGEVDVGGIGQPGQGQECRPREPCTQPGDELRSGAVRRRPPGPARLRAVSECLA